MHKCSVCGKLVQKAIYNYNSTRTCQECIPLTEQFHINRIEIDEAGPRLVELSFCADEKLGRQKFIDFIYLIFDGKVNPAAYRLMNNYRKKGYTWIGMIRAMEWFYLIKKNSTKKSNNNIGIIPHIYEEAQKFYKLQADRALQKAKHWYNSKDATTEETVVEKDETRKSNLIDMSEI